MAEGALISSVTSPSGPSGHLPLQGEDLGRATSASRAIAQSLWRGRGASGPRPDVFVLSTVSTKLERPARSFVLRPGRAGLFRPVPLPHAVRPVS
ncbi:hypothetical protein DDF67_00830 [Caulobacter endophyticus]|uniref:Uncharacterized protein n=1 Tax=Caulobacter endophyticus TaxID=2172652 RepID=A0A2T9KDK9_9CAUL|nr:hypothetical protein DDF67_00830 [Caulobacter endophyticus]